MTLTLMVALPLAGAAFLALLGGPLGPRTRGAIASLALAGSFGAALAMAPAVLTRSAPLDAPLWSWLPVQGADYRLLLDQPALWLVLMITLVSALISVYSIGYLARDTGTQRYFAALDLFVAAMLLIVTSSNLLLLFLGWELVGACSYLLIGHWRERPAAADAAVKAFVVNRIGDALLLVGIFAAFTQSGTVEISALGKLPLLPSLLILGGALAKSAQLPLHVWLPDAMEGPTPVSALIHAATMVTAGVVLLVRLGPSLAPEALLTAAVLGAITALGAATVASAQTDLKRVLAWSTISQVGLMFVAAGLGAVFAALFHLLSHAFFKATLFLAAGSVLHATHDELDVRRLGGLARQLRWTSVAFGVGALGLAAIPPASGFFSKEAIAAATLELPGFLVAVLLTSALSAFYAARLFTLVFVAPASSDGARTAREPSPPLLVPLFLLAAGVLAIGARSLAGEVDLGVAHGSEAPQWLLASSLVLALGGALAGWLRYRRGAREDRLLRIAASGFGIDALYRALAVRPVTQLATALDSGAERVNQAVLDGVAYAAARAGALARRAQGGYLRAYEALLLAGAVALLAYWSIR